MKQEFYTGRVKQYNADKGFGFISTTEGDIFFHISDFPASEGEPKRNEKVRFLAADNRGKFKAIKIERIDLTLRRLRKLKLLITIKRSQVSYCLISAANECEDQAFKPDLHRKILKCFKARTLIFLAVH